MAIMIVQILFLVVTFSFNGLFVFSQGSVRLSLPPPIQNFTSEYYLFTQQNPGVAENITTENLGNNLNSGAKTIFIIHGFTESGGEDWVIKMKNELLSVEELNVIIVDWDEGAAMFYPQAASNTKTMGQRLASLIQTVVDSDGVSLTTIHLIGHGLGAHIAGFTGKQLNLLGLGERLGRITGLDPSGPGFALEDDNDHLDITDAEFVDVIHSNDGELYQLAFGYLSGRSVGHADFYPNGGKVQPNCPDPDVRDLIGNIKDLPVNIACSHLKSSEYFTNSIKTCQYRSRLCQNEALVSVAVMGYHASSTLRGKFCLTTSNSPPFCEI